MPKLSRGCDKQEDSESSVSESSVSEAFRGELVSLEEEERPLDEQQASIEDRILHGQTPIPIVIEDGDVDSQSDVKRKSEDLGAIEHKLESELRSVIATVIDLTEDDSYSKHDTPQKQPPRNPSIEQDHTLLPYQHDGYSLNIGTVVEIKPLDSLYHAAFLKIQYIMNEPAGIILHGLPFTRTRNVRGQLPRLRNEVCLVLQIDADDERTDEEQGLVEIALADILAVRHLHCTNASFPELIRFDTNSYRSVGEIEERGMLVCRWKYRLVYKSAAARKNRCVPLQFVIEHLAENDITKEKHRASDGARLNAWRGGRIRGGSYNVETKTDLAVVEDLDEQPEAIQLQGDARRQEWIELQPGQRYSLGDMFSGAGGTSLGAQQAGFHVRLACDHAAYACMTHRHNFPDADLRESDIFSFIRDAADWERRYVDVLHLSPPCQFWSPAHTVPGVNDDANIAVLFSCHRLVAKLRPRLFTLEQTFGILHPRFEHYFNALLHGFTRHGYSVRWGIFNLVSWGLPSRRTRLLMIGSCPGEPLPPFPAPTHAGGGGLGGDNNSSSIKNNSVSGRRALKPCATVISALKRIPPGATLHDKRWRPWSWRRRPWNPHVPLARTITTHGGYGNYHYRGRRDFTLREYAVLNGFPARYHFEPRTAKRQIGNAFPPCVVRALYAHLRRWLERRDRVVRPGRLPSQGAATVAPAVVLGGNGERDDGAEELERKASAMWVQGEEDSDEYEEESECNVVELSDYEEDKLPILIEDSDDEISCSDGHRGSHRAQGLLPCIDPNQFHTLKPDLPVDLTRNSPPPDDEDVIVVDLTDRC
ncbi:S-adenosyl-L-methionine-dependent methyltransferase [Xylariales sp. PMI_506]|nr:S-adenosyl-L-methionine-dependent methyltransferase [Xylariales sp. PMI_506]